MVLFIAFSIDNTKVSENIRYEQNKNEVKELLCSLSEEQRHIVSHKKQEENDALDAVETVFSEGKHHDVAQHSRGDKHHYIGRHNVLY